MKKLLKLTGIFILAYLVVTWSLLSFGHSKENLIDIGLIAGFIAIAFFMLYSKLRKPVVKETLDTTKVEESESQAYRERFKPEDWLQMKNNNFDSKYLFPKKGLENTGHFFYAKKLVISGDFENFPFREELAKKLWEVGADIDTGISKNTDYALIGNANVGPSKMKKIIELNTKIIREDELLNYIPSMLSGFKNKEDLKSY